MKFKITASIAAAAIIANTASLSFTANAKVLEPEVVKTETWTTSYYIDEDTETLYPYIDCRADIYNDGTVKVYFWNTHEWDGFATVSHDVTLVDSFPIEQTLMNKTAKIRGTDNLYSMSNYPVSELGINVGYYNSDYSVNWNGDILFKCENYAYIQTDNILIDKLMYSGPLAYIRGSSKSDKAQIEFVPKVDPVGDYDFHILGHDIKVTPDILSSSIVAQPQLSENEKRIKELEEENLKLKNELNTSPVKYGDINGDNVIDGRDATVLLTYYAYTSTGHSISLEDFMKLSTDKTK